MITTFPSLTKPSPASVTPVGATPVASATSAAIAAVAAARAAAAASATQTPATTSSSVVVASTVNGRKRRNSNVTNGVSPSYPRMENSSNLSQSMDSVNTASGEEEVGIFLNEQMTSAAHWYSSI